MLAKFGVQLQEPDEILGFSSTVNGGISLTPIQTHRHVLVALVERSSGSAKLIFINEPFHDSNKIYSSLSGLPIGPFDDFLLESVGFESTMFDSIAVTSNVVNADHGAPPTLASALIGGSWIEQNITVSPSHKVLLAYKVIGASAWKGIVVSWGDFSNRDFTAENLAKCVPEEAFSELQPLLIVPIVCPLRVKREGGVVFVG